MRVTRTETNMAYRRADHERWQQMDFVLGIKIELSNQHPVTDICDFVQGDYPKDFVFDGWHPQCFCYATPILISEDEMAKVSEAFARGETYTPKGKMVTDTPKGFKKWVKDHKEQIQGAKNPPYWVKNNKAVVNGIWKEKLYANDTHSLKETSFAKTQKDLRRSLIRQDREHMAIVTPKGKIVHQSKGDMRSVSFDDVIAAKAKDNIMIHNHPTGKYSEDFKRFGYSLSMDDIYEAVSCNMKGIIAETKLYRYSVTRPEKGWSIDKEEIKKIYHKFYDEIKADYKKSLDYHNVHNVIQHLTMKRLSKELGFRYEYIRL